MIVTILAWGAGPVVARSGVAGRWLSPRHSRAGAVVWPAAPALVGWRPVVAPLVAAFGAAEGTVPAAAAPFEAAATGRAVGGTRPS